MGKGKKRHQIRPSQGPNRGERIAPHEARAPGSTNHLHPLFNLEHLGGRYCLSECTQEEKAAFADTVHRLSRMTWAEIQGAHKHGLGSETIPRHSLKAPLPVELPPDVRILAFRFHGNAPMVGYRDDRVFIVLFLDRDFTLYDHG